MTPARLAVPAGRLVPRIPARRRPSRVAVREAAVAYAFLAPVLVGFLVFVLGPAVAAVGLSFYHYDILSPPRFAGWANYVRFVRDPRLPAIYWNTVVYVVWYVALTTVGGLALAVAADRPLGALWRYLIRTSYFFPVLTSLASVSLVWQYLYNTDFGILNYYLGRLGVARIPWLTSSGWALPSIILLGVWKNVGFNFILFVAGLQNIPRHLYEAAHIDGAGRMATFRYVTLPSLTPVLFFTVVWGLINAFQIFDAPFILTTGGPGDASRTVVMYIYETGFRFFQMGYASTVALSLFAVVVVLTAIQFRLGRIWVFYQ
jgi:multiple sugar transport system permease protein